MGQQVSADILCGYAATGRVTPSSSRRPSRSPARPPHAGAVLSKRGDDGAVATVAFYFAGVEASSEPAGPRPRRGREQLSAWNTLGMSAVKMGGDDGQDAWRGRDGSVGPRERYLARRRRRRRVEELE
eukprot:CAMPEP_0170352190 /NCGR_PEP_ID=MMETSP0116_2-20130129/77405_1 /TAXON_ID=400756 /ORGANISM="Durinskia baltica, Strain CSIRO CS-38" /LENGTH=127 /DNA_ID=CAMNT_0010606113 /DNA_START=32 /DNA_END=416 /DNA_ORIENTATION=-